MAWLSNTSLNHPCPNCKDGGLVLHNAEIFTTVIKKPGGNLAVEFEPSVRGAKIRCGFCGWEQELGQ